VRVLAAIVGATLLSGCGGFATSGSSKTHASKLAQAQATHEYPSTPGPVQSVTGATATASASAVAAIRSFATRYINWQADDVAQRMESLAAQSVGQARSATALAAANTAQDYELQRGGVANSGTFEAIAPLLGQRNQYVVVTRERTTATATSAYQGLRPAWHLALATVVRLANGGWVLSRWQPES
jgi:hypothetical protein